MHKLALALLFALALAMPAGSALADKRVALVIGNSAYRNVPQLSNPKNDATDMAAKLSELGFDVVKGEDLDLNGVRNTIREFVGKLDGADMALFFYAGHGLQVNGSNYIAPVDARLANYIDLDFEMVPMDLILSAMEHSTKTNLIFLDSCRDNPLAENLARSMGTRSGAVSRGLAKIGTGIGSLIAFSTQPGNVALDGKGRNSPFTSALLKHLGTPGGSLTDELVAVRRDVIAATNGKQVPWDNSSLTGPVLLNEAAPKETSKPQPPVAQEGKPANAQNDEGQFEITFWNSIKDADSRAYFETYLNQYPAGRFAPIARLKMAEIEVRKAKAAARAEQDRFAAEKAEANATAEAEAAKQLKMASLEQPATVPPESRSIDPGELTRQTQLELVRLGCLAGGVDGIWGSGSQSALKDYAGRQGIKLTSLDPEAQVLDRLKATTVRVCPLVCARGMEEKNGQCERVKRQASVEPKVEPKSKAVSNGDKTPANTKSTANSGRVCITCWNDREWVKECRPARFAHELRGGPSCKTLQ